MPRTQVSFCAAQLFWESNLEHKQPHLNNPVCIFARIVREKHEATLLALHVPPAKCRELRMLYVRYSERVYELRMICTRKCSSGKICSDANTPPSLCVMYPRWQNATALHAFRFDTSVRRSVSVD